MRWLAAAAVLAALSGCSRRTVAPRISFEGAPPYGAMHADTRAMTVRCPECATPLPEGASACPGKKADKPCTAPLAPVATVPCGFCGTSRRCDPCAAFATGGRCRICHGSGRLDSAACFNCEGSGLCVACGGSASCDACRGTGTLSLPWKRPPAPARASRAPAASAGQVTRPDRYVAWLGETVSWEGAPESWTASRGQKGELMKGVQRLGRRFNPSAPGSYRVSGPGGTFHVEVIDLIPRSSAEKNVGPGTPVTATLETRPVLKELQVRWERVQGGGPVAALAGRTVTVTADVPGRQELWPVVEIPGQPARRGPQALAWDVSDLRIESPGNAPVRAGVPVPFKAVSVPPLSPDTAYEWTVSGPGGASRAGGAGPRARIPFPRAGRYEVRVRAGDTLSAPVSVAAYAVEALDAGDRSLLEAELALFDGVSAGADSLREEWVPAAPEHVRIVVEDPAPAPDASVVISTRRRDGTPLNPPVRYALSGEGTLRSTRPILFVGDREDDNAGPGVDDAPGDPTILAAVGGGIEVSYRGAAAVSLTVGPLLLHMVPVRFVAVPAPGDRAFPGRAELERLLDRRLEEANGTWERFGLRFSRESVELAEPPRNLLLIRGRAGGVDGRGRPAWAGFVVDGAEVSVPTTWQVEGVAMTPAETARALGKRLGAEWRAEVIEKVLAAAPEAVVLRVGRKGAEGRARLERLSKAPDVSQGTEPLAADLSDGCEVSGEASAPSVDEMALLLGLRAAGRKGLDVLVVGRLLTDREPRMFKVYAAGPFEGAALVSWEGLEGPRRKPYLLARTLGECLLPRDARAREGSTLFADPLSDAEAFGARKRVDAETGALLRASGVNLAARK